MLNNEELRISPSQVTLNSSITVRSQGETFPQSDYTITDGSGRIIRKGTVSERVTEFKLSVVGLATGAYRFSMGKVNQAFTIVF